jgi:protein gp37
MRHKAYLAGKKIAPQYAEPFETVQMMGDRLEVPARRRTPTRYFVNSVSDLFHEDVPDWYLDRVFAAMAMAPQHTFQVLTKRPARMLNYFTARDSHLAMTRCFVNFRDYTTPAGPWPLPNVWLGVSVENQAAANERIPLLLRTPAAIRFLSCEPLLGPLDLRRAMCTCPWFEDAENSRHHMGCPFFPIPEERPLHWVIVGGESGKNARPCNVYELTDIVAQCDLAGVPCFVKQMGSRPVTPDLTHWRSPATLLPDASGYALRLRDSHGGDPDEWPAELRVREFPTSGERGA